MFGLTDTQLLQNGIKIIDGIAGGGKSSKIDDFFRTHNIPYTRLTSTNRLSRDASIRYNMDVKTIAAGLFTNKGNHFYVDEKDAPSQHIVIDEILQADPKAIEWCIHHADTNNIIITTDSKQLLSPENEDKMIEAFTKLRMMKDVIYVNITQTLRARDNKTLKIYNELYGKADLPIMFDVKNLTSTFKNVIYYEDMEYSINDAYITHDNLTEDFLYKDKEFVNNPYLDLIPKGCIASKPPKDLRTYPLLSQDEAKRTHAKSYTQVMNVGTPVRFQGSEVMSDQKLYFMVQPDSVVSSRELYTVVTRMWSIDSFVIVLVNTPKPYVLNEFFGLPVKTHRFLTIDDGGEFTALSPSQMNKLVSKYDTDDIYYDRDEVRDGRGNTRYISTGASRESFKPGTSTIGSLSRRDAKLNFSYMDEVYSILEKNNINHIRGIHRLGKHNKDIYEVDMNSAHPTLLKYEKMPCDGLLTTDGPSDDKLNFYLYKGYDKGFTEFTSDCLVTDVMKDYMESKGYGPFTYLFSTPYTVGTYPGDFLHAKAHNTVESKADIKGMHYGYFQKPYIQLASDKSCYVRYENYRYELLICQIFSMLTYYMCKLSDEINGSGIVVDAVRFPCYNDDIKNKIKATLPDWFDWRISLMADKRILYKTYEDLPTMKEKKKKSQAAWYQENKERLKAKNTEYKRLYRQRKKEEKMKGENHDEQKQ